MLTKARIAGHPIHPMVVAFPIAFYVTTVVALVAFLATGDRFWYSVGLYANIAGVVMAAVAAIPGLIDLLHLERGSRPRATGIRHAGFNVLALLLFAGSAAILYRNSEVLDVTAPLVLGALGMLATVSAGWLGFTLVQTHHVGVKSVAEPLETDVQSPPDFDMPASYREEYRQPLH